MKADTQKMLKKYFWNGLLISWILPLTFRDVGGWRVMLGTCSWLHVPLGKDGEMGPGFGISDVYPVLYQAPSIGDDIDDLSS
jgi:hypothetical protein